VPTMSDLWNWIGRRWRRNDRTSFGRSRKPAV
jgi:hypothetical protein